MDLLRFVIALLGLPADTPEDGVRTELETRLGGDGAAMSTLGRTVKAKLGWATVPADAEAQIDARLAASGVPHAEHLAVLGQLEALKASAGRPDLVARGRETGKLTPSMEGAFKAMLASQGHAAAAAWLDAAPVVIESGTQAKRPPAASAGELTPEELAACTSMKVTPAQYLAAKQA